MTAEEFHKQWRSAGQLSDHITCYAACVFAEAYAALVASSKAAKSVEITIKSQSVDDFRELAAALVSQGIDAQITAWAGMAYKFVLKLAATAAEAPGGQEFVTCKAKIHSLLDVHVRNLDCEHVTPAPAAHSERADAPQLGKCTQSTFGHSGLHRKSWACGNGFVPVCPTCGSHLSSQEGK